jgi:hypothetical protein
MRVLDRGLGPLVVLSSVGASVAVAQAPPRPAEWIVEQQHRERWMHRGQQARLSPFAIHQRMLYVDSIRARDGGRRFFITSARTAFGRDSAMIVTDSLGRISSYVAAMAPYRNDAVRWPGDSARMARFRRFRNPGFLELIEARMWDLVPTFPARPNAGVRWTDTIAREALDGLHRQEMTGHNTSWVVRDTIIDGRRLWFVRDSASLRYTERYPEPERTLGTDAEVTRVVSGVERGMRLFDPVIGLDRWRHDTAVMRGEAVLRYADGREFRTPASYERTRYWVLRDSNQHAARVAELNAEMRRSSGGMVRTPTSVQRRVMEGDAAVRDSLTQAWQRSADPNDAEDTFRTLNLWSGRDSLFARRLDSMRMATGDSVFLYRRLANRAYSGRTPADSADVARMIGFMEHPEIAWSFNMSRDWLYENLVQALTTHPPAVARDDERVGCTPAACRLLGEQWRSAKEPRTRDVGLVALYVVDPARWADTVLSLASPGRPLLESAVHLARGVASTAPTSAKRVMPPRASDTTAWIEWMVGLDSAYAEAQRATARRLGRPETERRLQFSPDHSVAIRMHMKQTGRNIVGELRSGYASARSERERFIYGTMLRGLGEMQLTPEQIAQDFRSGIPERVALAREALVMLLGREARVIDTAIARPIMDRMIAVIVESWPLWPPGTVDMGPGSAGRPELHARRGRVRLSAENLPADLLAKWGTKVEIVTPANRGQIDPREATVIYTVSRVTGVGPFLKIEMRADEQLERPADHTPAHYASATTYYLMNRDGEWVLVAASGWVT